MTQTQSQETKDIELDQSEAIEQNSSEDHEKSNSHEVEEKKQSDEKIPLIKRLLGNKKRLLLVVGIFLLLLLVLIGLWLFFFSGSDSAEEKPDAGLPEQAAPVSDGWKDSPVFEDVLDMAPFEKIVMNQGSAKGFVNMDISLQLVDSADRVEVFSKIDSIRRLVQDNIRQKTWIDIRSPQGKIKCKYELISAINALFGKKVLKDLYITNFIML